MPVSIIPTVICGMAETLPYFSKSLSVISSLFIFPGPQDKYVYPASPVSKIYALETCVTSASACLSVPLCNNVQHMTTQQTNCCTLRFFVQFIIPDHFPLLVLKFLLLLICYHPNLKFTLNSSLFFHPATTVRLYHGSEKHFLMLDKSPLPCL